MLRVTFNSTRFGALCACSKNGGAHYSCGSEHCWCELNDARTATSEGGLSLFSKLYNTAKKENPGRQILQNRTILATPLLAQSCLIWGGQQWGSG